MKFHRLRKYLYLQCVVAEEKLVPDQDRIDTPAMTEGLSVHNLFQSNMVIQRERPIPIWGWASPGEKITATLGSETKTVAANADRAWRVEFSPRAAKTEPQTIVVQGKDKKVVLENILIGDVWLLGGQSNMEFELHKVEEGPLEIISANFDQIRLFTCPSKMDRCRESLSKHISGAISLANTFDKGIGMSVHETVRDMSGIGYVFGEYSHGNTRSDWNCRRLARWNIAADLDSHRHFKGH